jgi:hypothetical protein
MAERLVVLGWAGRALEIPSASDAAACVYTGMLRVSLTKWGGPLANATVLQFTGHYLDAVLPGGGEETYRQAWKNLLALPMHPRPVEFELETPIPLTA